MGRVAEWAWEIQDEMEEFSWSMHVIELENQAKAAAAAQRLEAVLDVPAASWSSAPPAAEDPRQSGAA